MVHIIYTTIPTILTIAGFSLLWRNFRYDTDNPLYSFFENLPYGIRKPITCGLCVTYWITLLVLCIYNPLFTYIFPALTHLPVILQYSSSFISTWMITGTVSVMVVYFIDTLYQVSHFFAHKAHESHQHTHTSSPEEIK